MKKDAILSEDRKYRYVLSRIWNENKAMVTFIGLNPSTANEIDDDPTINKCIRYAESWGYGGIYMLNLFALRSPYPNKLYEDENPIGNDNNKYLKEYFTKSEKLICAWGNHGSFKNRSKDVLELLEEKYYLKLNNTGEPAHPLYLKKILVPIKF